MAQRRFKTRWEFEKEFGVNWRNHCFKETAGITPYWVSNMDYLFGLPFEGVYGGAYHHKNKAYADRDCNWCVSEGMTTTEELDYQHYKKWLPGCTIVIKRTDCNGKENIIGKEFCVLRIESAENGLNALAGMKVLMKESKTGVDHFMRLYEGDFEVIAFAGEVDEVSEETEEKELDMECQGQSSFRRFKTEEELIKEFGTKWWDLDVYWNTNHMNHLFGLEFNEREDVTKYGYLSTDESTRYRKWGVSDKWFTNKPFPYYEKYSNKIQKGTKIKIIDPRHRFFGTTYKVHNVYFPPNSIEFICFDEQGHKYHKTLREGQFEIVEEVLPHIDSFSDSIGTCYGKDRVKPGIKDRFVEAAREKGYEVKEVKEWPGDRERMQSEGRYLREEMAPDIVDIIREAWRDEDDIKVQAVKININQIKVEHVNKHEGKTAKISGSDIAVCRG